MGLLSRFGNGKRARGQRIRYDVKIHRVYNVLPGTSQLRVVLKRGNKHVTSQVTNVVSGEAILEEVLSLTSTLLLSESSGQYERKELVFNVRQVNGFKQKTYGNVVLDASNFAPQEGNVEGSPTEFKVALFQGNQELPTHLHITIKSQLILDAEIEDSTATESDAASEADSFRLAPSKPAPQAANNNEEEVEEDVIICNEAATYLVRARDTFGNKMTTGGDRTEARLQGPPGTKANSTIKTSDFNDGMYGVSFVPDKPGAYLVTIIFNGANPGVTKRFKVVSSGLVARRAMDCVLRGDGVGLVDTVTGSTLELFIQSLRHDQGEAMSGNESVSVRVSAPSGVVLPAPLAFLQGRFKATLYWPETGKHKVEAKIGGENVPGSPYYVNASPQAVFLPVCQMYGPGLSLCVAGERATFIIEARDARGNRVLTGKANFKVKSETHLETVQGVILDRGDGSYEASYMMLKSGPFVLTVSDLSASVPFEGVCVAGKAVVSKCFVSEFPEGAVLAGEAAAVRVDRRDVGGNRVEVSQTPLAFSAQSAGPGVALVTTTDQADGSCSIGFKAEIAGNYTLHILGGPNKELLPGSPLDLTVEPNVPVAHMLVVSTEGVSKTRRGQKGDGHEVEEPVAGQRVTLNVAARDAYGNSAFWEEEDLLHLVVHVERGDGSPHGETFALDGVEGGKAMWTGVFTLATALVVHVRFGNAVVPTWPRIMQVVAGRCDPMSCTVFSLEPEIPLWRETFQVRVQAKDVFGNLLPVGGDTVDGFLEGPNGVSDRPDHVEDHGNGTYTIYCMLGSPGAWTLLIRVNDEGEHQYHLQVEYGPLKAHHCEMLVDRGKNDEVTVGHVSDLAVQPVDYVEAGHAMSGDEALILRLASPSGVPIFVPLEIEDGRFLGKACWVEVGAYTVMGFLNQEHVQFSPLTVHCIPEGKVVQDREEAYTDMAGMRTGRPPFGDIEAEDDGVIPLIMLKEVLGDEVKAPAGGKRATSRPGSRGGPRKGGESIGKDGGSRQTSTLHQAGGELIRHDDLDSFHEEEGRSKVSIGERNVADQGASASVESMTDNILGFFGLSHRDNEVSCGAEGRNGRGRSMSGGPSRNRDRARKPKKVTVELESDTSLETSLIQGEGMTKCTAGEQGTISIVARNRRGEPVTEGGDNFMAFVKTSTGQLVECKVSDNKDGTYVVNYVMEKAGPMTLSFRLHGSERRHQLSCEPAECDPQKCGVDVSDLAMWKVGMKAKVLIERRDRFGNRITNRAGQTRITALGSGPGKLEVSTVESEDGSCQVLLSSSKCGQYKIKIFEAGTNREFCGSPMLAMLHPGQPLPRKCEVKVLSKSTTITKKGVIAADVGSNVEIALNAFDACGNPTEWDDAQYPVMLARGPVTVQIPEVSRHNNQIVFRQVFSRSGGYTLQAALGESPITAGDKVLLLQPGRADAARCLIDAGRVPGGVLETHVPRLLVVQAADAFGNLCLSGGEAVGVLMKGDTSGSEVHATEFDDRGDGTYLVPVTVDSAGLWSCQVVVNGKPSSRAVLELEAIWGKIQPADVMLQGGGSQRGKVTCSDVETLYIQPLDFGQTGRRLLGNEALVVRVATPTGVSEAVQLHFTESVGRYSAKLCFTQAGPHEVTVLLDGSHVPGSPYTVVVQPSELWLPGCRLVGKGIQLARAGEAATFTVQAADRAGSQILHGGATFNVRVQSAGDTVHATVSDNQDGTYSVVYMLTRAGPFKVLLSQVSEERIEFGSCEAGPTSMAKSLILGDRAATWIAGHISSIKIVRCDAHENVVPFAEGLLRFDIRCNGPGEVVSTPVELGDGTLDLRCVAKVAGEYQVAVYGLDPDGAPKKELNDSPMLVTVLPAPIDPASCLAGFGSEIGEVEGAAVAVAGEYVEVVIAPRDAYGNATEWNDDLVFHVEAEGPNAVALDRARQHEAILASEFGAVFKTAGTYLVKITAGRTNIKGWPRILQVIPGPVAPSRCTIKNSPAADAAGSPLNNIQADSPVSILLRARDDFGNFRSEGGDMVQCMLSSSRDHQVHAEVVDLEDGTYSMQFVVPAVGRWCMKLIVNGTNIAEAAGNQAAFEFDVADGPMRSDGLTLYVDTGNRQPPLACGTASDLIIQVVDEERQLTGRETISMRVTAPSGISSMLSFTMDESRAYVSAQYHWSEVGEFVISATLDGHDVRNSPATIQVSPQTIHLATSAIEWPTSTVCEAGKPTKFVVQAHDNRGNRVQVGGEQISFEVLLDERIVMPKTDLVDLSKGNYEGTIVLEKVTAVPYQVRVNVDSEVDEPARLVRVTCVAGPTHFPLCSVDVADEPMETSAGQWTSFSILRRDRFGNAVLDTTTPGFHLEASGPSKLQTELIDQAGGRCEARLMATLAGTYNLKVYGRTQDPFGVKDKYHDLNKGEVTVQVDPAHVSPAHTMAWVFNVDAGETPPGPGEDLAMAVVVQAGQHIDVYLEARDAYENVAVWGYQILQVLASQSGHEDYEFAEEDIEDPNCRVMSGLLTRAGTFTLTAKVDGVAPPGWPRTLQLVPGPVDAEQCIVRGPALSGAVCGAPSDLLVVAADTYGNPCSTGGEHVEVVLEGPDDENNMVTVEAVDNKDGTYSAAFELNEPGTWGVSLLVNNRPCGRAGLSFYAQPGFIKAEECVIQRDDSAGPLSFQFGDDVILVGTLDENRTFSGQELVLLQVRAPSRSTQNSPMQYDQATSTWFSDVKWIEKGTHQVSAFVNGVPVTDSPLTIKVRREGDDGTGPEMDTDDDLLMDVMRASRTPNKGGSKSKLGLSTAQLERMHPSELAEYLRDLDSADAADALAALSPSAARDAIISMMDSDKKKAANVLNNSISDKAAEILSNVFQKDLRKGTGLMEACIHDDPERAASTAAALAQRDRKTLQGLLKRLDDRVAFKMLKAGSVEDLSWIMSCMDDDLMSSMCEHAMNDGSPSDGAALLKNSLDAAKKCALRDHDDEMIKRLAQGFAKAAQNQSDGELTALLEQMEPEDVAYLLLGMDAEHIKHLLSMLDAQTAAEISDHLSDIGTRFGLDLGPMVSLPQSVLLGDGLHTCTAGQPATFFIETCNSRGEPITRGGALLYVLISAGGQEMYAHVEDLRSGKYKVTYELTLAGVHSMSVKMQGFLGNEEVGYMLECLPCSVDLSKTKVEADQFLGNWIAGDWAEAKVIRCDRFGNKVLMGSKASSTGVFQLPHVGATATGPGDMEVEVEEQTDGTCVICMMCKTAGVYTIDILGTGAGYFGSANSSSLPGSPFQCRLTPGPTDCQGSALEVLNAKQESREDIAVVTAGEQIVAIVRSQDEFQNPTEWDPEAIVAVQVQELDIVYLDLLETTSTTMTFAGQMTRAGIYRLLPTIDHMTIGQGHKLLQVMAREADPYQSMILQKPPVETTCGRPIHVTVLASDVLGNACIGGGDSIDVHLQGSGRASAPSKTVDNADGTYTIEFELPGPGVWRATPVLNGRPMLNAQFSLNAKYGEVTAQEVVIIGGAQDETLFCGSTADLLIQARSLGGYPRLMNGNELLAVTLTAPSKIRQSMPLALLEGGAHYQCTLTFSEVGKHTVEVQIGGINVQGSPYSTLITPQDIFLPNCFIEGQGISNCVAGMNTSFVLIGRDRHGNSMSHGGRYPLSINVFDVYQSAKHSRSALRDNQDGTFLVEYQVTRSGQYAVEITGRGPEGKFVLVGMCTPGQTSPPHCRLDTEPLRTGTRRWVVGKPLPIAVTRFDKYNNVVSSPVDDKPTVRFTAEVSGSGQVATDLVEVGDGSFEVRLTGRTVGNYSVSLQSGSCHVMGSPFEVFLYPSRATAFTCRTTIVGVQQNAGSSGVLLARAGDPIAVEVEPLDQYGNATLWEDDQHVTVELVCQSDRTFSSNVSSIEFQKDFTQSPPGSLGQVDTFNGSLTRTGSYIVWVKLNAQVISGWPRILEVQPGGIDPSKAEVEMDEETRAKTQGFINGLVVPAEKSR